MTLLPVFGAFVAGAIYEALCVWWVAHSQDNRPLKAGGVSIVLSTCMVLGIGEGIHGVASAAGWVVGSATGTTLAVWWKSKRKAA